MIFREGHDGNSIKGGCSGTRGADGIFCGRPCMVVHFVSVLYLLHSGSCPGTSSNASLIQRVYKRALTTRSQLHNPQALDVQMSRCKFTRTRSPKAISCTFCSFFFPSRRPLPVQKRAHRHQRGVTDIAGVPCKLTPSTGVRSTVEDAEQRAHFTGGNISEIRMSAHPAPRG